MRLAGLEIPTLAVTELVEMLREECYFEAADALERAVANEQVHVSLTIREQTAILDVLDDPPREFLQLRAALLNEHEWRACIGLVAPRPVR